MTEKSFMIVGVGGQGTLLASRIIGNVFLKKGKDVKISEVHGMSQRGGSVVTYVKYGDKVYSPIVEKGEADFILAFEELEAYRWIPYLKKNGKLIVITNKIDPMPVIIGAAEYPENIVEKIKKMNIDVVTIDALDLAIKAGNSKTTNVVLLGKLASVINDDKDLWIEEMVEHVPQKLVDINSEAFEFGYGA